MVQSGARNAERPIEWIGQCANFMNKSLKQYTNDTDNAITTKYTSKTLSNCTDTICCS